MLINYCSIDWFCSVVPNSRLAVDDQIIGVYRFICYTSSGLQLNYSETVVDLECVIVLLEMKFDRNCELFSNVKPDHRMKQVIICYIVEWNSLQVICKKRWKFLCPHSLIVHFKGVESLKRWIKLSFQLWPRLKMM